MSLGICVGFAYEVLIFFSFFLLLGVGLLVGMGFFATDLKVEMIGAGQSAT